jgi:hypothetical protein
MLRELVALLARRELLDEDVDAVCEVALSANLNPELAFLEDSADRLLFAIAGELADYVALSDKVDELHAQLAASLSGGLPPFPALRDAQSYHRWLDAALAAAAPDVGGYAALGLDCSPSDEQFATIVYRADVPRLLALGQALGVRLRALSG